MTEADRTPPQQWKSILVGGGLLAAGVCLGAGVMYSTVSPSATAPSSLGDAPALPNPNSGAPECGVDGSFDWQSLSSIDPDVQPALKKAFVLLNTRREDCEDGGFPELPWKAVDFEQGPNHSHYVHARHKYATTCDGETFKLHFHFGSAGGKIEAEPTSFVAQVFHDMQSDAWSLLTSDPAPCDIETGGASYPEPLPADDKIVKNKADFAASELGYQMKKKGCLENDKHLEVTRIEEARSQVEAGLAFDLVLFLKVANSSNEPKEVKLRVLEDCDLTQTGRCVDELSLPSFYADVCAPMNADVPAEVRRLSDPDRRRLGHIPVDATEYLVAQRRLLDPRRLASGERPPLQERHITSGDVPSQFDPREHHCYRRITVYDQGSCGSCYAQAAAQMIGIRKCVLDEDRRRRLVGKQQTPGRFLEKSSQGTPMSSVGVARKTTDDCECLKEWKYGGSTCSDSCCNPDNSDGEWCFVKDKSCQSHNWGYCTPSGSPETPDACEDSEEWADEFGDSCAWYAEHDPGCAKHTDYGQLVHCKSTCGTCPPQEQEDPSDDDSGPWSHALYEYMPTVHDVAQCANDGERPRGCDGGNMHCVWNEWMSAVTRDLNLDGEQCMPYQLKCWESSGVVNPLTGGACANYEGDELWHKPCSFIPHSARPKSIRCPSTQPSSSCSFQVPPLAFVVKNVAHGLSIADAMLNMQRHIHEYGPIYVSFSTTQEFLSWDWNAKPIYTGGRSDAGGHAVILVGWGRDDGTDHWIMRNSWGPGWADKGHCKFKRGENLDGIEGREVVAVMPEEDIQDFSAPSCRFLRWETSWSYGGSELSALELKLHFKCNKQATFDVWHSGSDGTWQEKQTVQASANWEFFVPVDALCGGFGVRRAGDMKVSYRAEDTSGNEATNQHTIQIQAVGGMSSADRSQC